MEYITNSPPGQGLIYTGKNVIPFSVSIPKDTKIYRLLTSNPKEKHEYELERQREERKRSTKDSAAGQSGVQMLKIPEEMEAEMPFKLCHRCNNKIPRLDYCLAMYADGSKFKQKYGWFINQEYFRCGIDPYQLNNVLVEKCPTEIFDFRLRCNTLQRRLDTNPDDPNIQDELAMYNREFHKSIENRARESLGFKKSGETWVSETILFNIVEGLYPTSKVIRQHRPKWLQGLELDIYLPEHKLAFEYQGIQHFVAVEHWGG